MQKRAFGSCTHHHCCSAGGSRGGRGEVTTATAIEGRGGTRGGEQVVSYIKRAGSYMSEFCLSRTPPIAPTRED